MKTPSLSKVVSICLALLFLCCFSLPLLPANASASTVLTIGQVTVTEDMLGENALVAVDVTIKNNNNGFLATSFGIQYDPTLTLQNVSFENAAGEAHGYYQNDALGLVWFSGAVGNAIAVANTDEEVMLTMYFSLPADMTAGTSYPIEFVWQTPNGTQAYWHIQDRSNIVGNLRANCSNGAITYPDPNAPAMSQASLQIAAGDTAALSVLNYDGSITWFSDNSTIADVLDGLVQAISVGSCRIYAYLDTNTMLTCDVTVTEGGVYDISETPVVYLKDPSKTVTLTLPVNATGTPTWLSENTSIATVNGGVVTGIQNGSTTVFALLGSTIYKTIVVVDFPENALCGDVNLDGGVSIADVILLNQAILGDTQLTDAQRICADSLQDGLIDGADSLLILQNIVELVGNLPVVPA